MKPIGRIVKIQLAGWLLLLMLAWPARQAWATGACTAARFHCWQDMGCNQNNAGTGGVPKAKCPDCPGMPQWWVSEPYVDLCMSDTPLSYTLSSGQEMSFKFYYRQRTKMPDFDEIPSLNSFYPRDYPGTVNGSNCGTNASWRNNWTMGITFWDTDWENHWFLGPFDYWYPPRNYAVFTNYYEALVIRPEGGMNYFYNTTNGSSLQDPRSQMHLQPISTHLLITNQPSSDANGIFWGDPNVGFSLTYPDGSQDIFGLTDYHFSPDEYTVWGGSGMSSSHGFLTQRLDPQGRVTRLGYEVSTNVYSGFSWRLKYVVDPDGRTNTFLYNHGYQIAEIDDPYGRKVTLGYGTNLVTSNLLTSITDAAGMASSFQYQPGMVVWNINPMTGQPYGPPYPPVPPYGNTYYNGWINSLTTPYGTTTFNYCEVTDSTVTDGIQQRAIYISEPEGAQQLYYYLHNNASVSATDTSPTNIPGQSFDDGTAGGSGHQALTYRNTYHWGRRQFAALPGGVQSIIAGNLSNALTQLTTTNYNLAQLRHWLLSSNDQVSITESLSSERDPSPDAAGQTTGLRTWYNYQNKPVDTNGRVYLEQLGSNPQVSCIARLLPDGSSQYTTYNFYPTNQPGAGLVSDNESSYSKPDGSVSVLTNWFRYAANSVDLISVSNSVGQSVNLSYNTNHQVMSVTNALSQVTALSWDPYTFNLTGVQLPAGKSIGLGYYAQSSPPTGASAMISQITIQPEDRVFNLNNYQAGNPSSITDDRGVTVANTWDGLNRLTGTTFPDGTSVSNIYSRLDLAATKDRLGNWTSYAYDGLRHLTNIINANRAVTTLSWCGCGSLSAIYDAQNGLANPTYLNYDNQGNLTNVTYPDNTSLTYQFDLAGRMTNAFDGAGRSVQLGYNNQGLATTISGAFGTLQLIVYDTLNRPIIVTDANGVTVTNTYDAINELLKRTWPDGISEGFGYSTNGLIAYTNRDQKVTLLGRDTAGRIIAVTNANNEIILAGYDSLDNITILVDGLLHTNTWQYNEYGWLTNKVDALNRNIARYVYNANGWVTSRQTPEKGNTSYGYDNAGNLKTISYPQSSVTYAYDALNRLTNMVDPFGTTAFGYTPAGQLQSENGP
jgi:YD repeat-containing protein